MHDRCCPPRERFDQHDGCIPKNRTFDIKNWCSSIFTAGNYRIHLSTSFNGKSKIIQFLPWDRPVDRTAQSSRHRVYPGLSQPRRCKAKYPKKRCKIDKRSWFFSFASAYPVDESINVKSEVHKNITISNSIGRNLVTHMYTHYW